MTYDEWLATLLPFEAKALTRREIFQAGAASRDAEVARLEQENDQLRAQINKLREAINRQPYTMDREVCEALAATPEQSLAEYRNKAADRIEELERERDAFYMDYRMKCDEEAKDSALVIIENDQLRAHINVLREALKFLSYMAQTTGNVMGKDAGLMDGIKAAEQALATPEQSLAEYRNKVIEAFVNEFSRHVGGDGEFWLHELQDFAMKEQST